MQSTFDKSTQQDPTSSNPIRAAVTVATVETLRNAVWQDGADIDALVDWFARTHAVKAYREANIQKAAIDEFIEKLAVDHRLNDLCERLYTRFLLAADVGFELGFAAAQNLRMK